MKFSGIEAARVLTLRSSEIASPIHEVDLLAFSN